MTMATSDGDGERMNEQTGPSLKVVFIVCCYSLALFCSLMTTKDDDERGKGKGNDVTVVCGVF